jgi:hypothetical protein
MEEPPGFDAYALELHDEDTLKADFCFVLFGSQRHDPLRALRSPSA